MYKNPCLKDDTILLLAGQTQTLKAIITPADASNQKVTWQSSANNGNASTWRKVDDNLGETDNPTTGDVSNPLWKVVP